jgi:hypothetical protein
MFRKFGLAFHGLLRVLMGLFVVPFATVPATAKTLTTMNATALRQQAWDKVLREDSTLDDVFNRLKNAVDVRMSSIEIPNAIFMEFENPSVSTHKLTFPFTTPLKKSFQMGTDEDMLGNEEDLDLMHLTIRYNEIKKAVSHRGWGIDFNDLSWTGLYGTLTPKFVQAYQELRGRRIREALMLTVAEELTKNPVGLKQQFNSNVFICNLGDFGNQPVWDVTDLTKTDGAVDSLGLYPSRNFRGANSYVESIAAKMLTGAGTGSTSKAVMNVDALFQLDLYVRTRLKLIPLEIGKRKGYIFLCPSDVAAYLTNPKRSGSLGEAWASFTNLTAEEQSIPGIAGRVRSLWIVEDERAPTLTVGGSTGTYTLTPGFVQPGDNDDRNLNPWSNTSGSTNYVFEVGFVIGKGALAEWVVNDLQYAKESTEYGKFLGKGSWMCGGIQLARFEKDTPDDANNSASTGQGKTIIQRGSCMVLISRAPVAPVV